jgi:hypothetical protein
MNKKTLPATIKRKYDETTYFLWPLGIALCVAQAVQAGLNDYIGDPAAFLLSVITAWNVLGSITRLQEMAKTRQTAAAVAKVAE